MIERESIMPDNGLINMAKRIGPSTEPCGSPECTGGNVVERITLLPYVIASRIRQRVLRHTN